MSTTIVLHLSDDLIFASRVTAAVRDRGWTCFTARDAGQLLARANQSAPTCVIVDLANPGLALPDALAGLSAQHGRPRVVAYGAHVDAAGLRAARAAGCDLVLPRSQFVEDLPTRLPEWAGKVG